MVILTLKNRIKHFLKIELDWRSRDLTNFRMIETSIPFQHFDHCQRYTYVKFICAQGGAAPKSAAIVGHVNPSLHFLERLWSKI